MIQTYFEDVKNPTMSELVNWLQVEFTDLANDMKNSDHHAIDSEPNPYHLEDSVWTHTMMVCLQAQNDNTIVKLVALLHDVGKPMARDVIPFGAPKPDYNGEARITTKEHTTDGSRKLKTIFRGHEGISFWLAIDPLKTLQMYGVIDEDDINEILHLVSLHGTLFNRLKDGIEHKPEQVVGMFDDILMYNNFVACVRNDSTGRFHVNQNSRSDVGVNLGKTIYTEDTFFDNFNDSNIWDNWSDSGNPTVHLLVGLPACGKTTFLEGVEGTVISKDTVIMEMGQERGLSAYTDIYKALSKEEHKEAYKITMERYHEATMKREDVFVDLTNMSKKSRNKYIHNLKDYNKVAVVFVTGQANLFWRNLERSKNQGKYISDGVYKNMMMSFLVPTLYEFDEVRYVHG